MKYSKKMCAHDKAIVALNADNKKYLSYEKSINATLFEMYVSIVMTVQR